MTQFLLYGFFASLAATVLILGVGISGFIFGTEFNQKYGNRLMQARVISQGVTLGLFTLLLLYGVRP